MRSATSHEDIHTLIVRRHASLDEEARLRWRARLLAIGGPLFGFAILAAAAACLFW
jgi:hypothetical protein